MDRISILNEKLVCLKRLDGKFSVHGASSHRYKTYPLSEKQVTQIEARAGNRLPNDMREWLIRVGFGAGPSYGLFRMGGRKWREGWSTLNKTLSVWTDTPSEPLGLGEFRSLSEISSEEAQRKINETMAAPRTEKGFPVCGPPKFTTKSYLGGSNILTLAHDGGSFWYVTPLTGPLKGKVFFSTEETIEEVDGEDIDWAGAFWLQGLVRNNSHGWFNDAEAVLFNQIGDAFDFLDWMEYWLNEELFFVRNLDQYNAQVARHPAEIQKRLAEERKQSN